MALSIAVSILGPGCQKQPGAAGGAPAAAGPMAVQVIGAEARAQTVSENLSLVGTVAPNEIVEIKSEVEGVVQEVLFDEGQAVKKGDLLLRLDESKFAATVAQAEANFMLSRSTFERARQLFDGKLISQQEFDQAAATYQANEAGVQLRRRELRDARIYAPFAGVTGARTVSPGQVIGVNTLLTSLVDLDSMKVEIPVPERFLGVVSVGQKVELKVAAFAGQTFAGEVYFIAPQLDPATRTALVKARVPNAERRLKGGMFASLELTLKLKENAVVIPESAVMATGDRTSVYVIGPDGTAQIRPVRLGIRLEGRIEVVSGIQAGERVVAEGVQKVRPGGKVMEAAQASAPAGGAPGNVGSNRPPAAAAAAPAK